MEYANTQLSAKKRGVKKSQFLKTEASPTVKKTAFTSLIIFVVIAALIVTAAITTNATSLEDLPVFALVMDEGDRKELKREMENSADLLDDAEDLLEDIEEEYGVKTSKAAKNLIKKTKAATKTMSINNVIGMMNALNKLVDIADENVLEEMDMSGIDESFDELTDILKVIRSITYIFAVIIILLALWSAFGKITGLSILCLILYVPVCALISSVLLAVLIAAAFIALAVTTSRVNKAWKTA